MTIVTPSAPIAHRKRKVVQAVPMMPARPAAVAGVATLPMRTVGVGAAVSVGGWMIPVAGALVGGLLLGLPGALAGGIAGYLLAVN